MAITVQPPLSALASNRPIVFIASIVTGLNVEFAQVRLRNADGTLLLEYNVPVTIAIFGGFIFVIDVQQAVKQVLAPKVSSLSNVTDVFTEDPTDSYVALNSDCYRGIFINVDYFYRLPNGQTAVILGATDTSDVFSVFAAHLQQNDPYEIEAYLPDAGFGYRTLTSRPFGTAKIGIDKPMFVSLIINETINAMRVTVNNGGAPQTAIKFLPTDPDAPYWQITAGVGIPQLIATTFDSGAIVADPNATRVIIEFGVAVNIPILGGVIWLTELTRFIYNIADYCKDSVAVCFLNQLGGADVAQFKLLDSLQRYSTERRISQKAQNYNPLIGDYFSNSGRGRFALSIDSVKKYRLKATTQNDAVTQWLASLINSPEIYFAVSQAQRPANFLLPVLVDNTEMLIATPNGSREQIFEFSEANNVQIPQY